MKLRALGADTLSFIIIPSSETYIIAQRVTYCRQYERITIPELQRNNRAY